MQVKKFKGLKLSVCVKGSAILPNDFAITGTTKNVAVEYNVKNETNLKVERISLLFTFLSMKL